MDPASVIGGLAGFIILVMLTIWCVTRRQARRGAGIRLDSGEVRLPVHGRVFHGNQPEGSVINGRLVGNLIDVLQQVVEVASDTDRIGHVDAPGIIVDGFRLEL